MAYASFDDVVARSGRFAGVFSVTGKHPNQTDVEAFLGDTAAEIDEAIRARGFDPDTMAQDAKAGLVDLNAYGALARALTGLNLGPEGAQVATEALLVWDLAMGAKGSIAAGTHPVIAALLAGQAGEPARMGGDFFDDEPSYGGREVMQSEANVARDTNLAPAWTRRQAL